MINYDTAKKILIGSTILASTGLAYNQFKPNATNAQVMQAPSADYGKQVDMQWQINISRNAALYLGKIQENIKACRGEEAMGNLNELIREMQAQKDQVRGQIASSNLERGVKLDMIKEINDVKMPRLVAPTEAMSCPKAR